MRGRGRRDVGPPARPRCCPPPVDPFFVADLGYPWRTVGRLDTAGGWATGVLVGPRHVLTAAHVLPWRSQRPAGRRRRRGALRARRRSTRGAVRGRRRRRVRLPDGHRPAHDRRRGGAPRLRGLRPRRRRSAASTGWMGVKALPRRVGRRPVLEPPRLPRDARAGHAAVVPERHRPRRPRRPRRLPPGHVPPRRHHARPVRRPDLRLVGRRAVPERRRRPELARDRTSAAPAAATGSSSSSREPASRPSLTKRLATGYRRSTIGAHDRHMTHPLTRRGRCGCWTSTASSTPSPSGPTAACGGTGGTGTATADGVEWPIWFSPTVTGTVARLHETGVVEVRWLTTWGAQANGELRALLGMPELEVAGEPPHVTGDHGAGSHGEAVAREEGDEGDAGKVVVVEAGGGAADRPDGAGAPGDLDRRRPRRRAGRRHLGRAPRAAPPAAEPAAGARPDAAAAAGDPQLLRRLGEG